MPNQIVAAISYIAGVQNLGCYVLGYDYPKVITMAPKAIKTILRQLPSVDLTSGRRRRKGQAHRNGREMHTEKSYLYMATVHSLVMY